ncbi:MAG: hypothetical protein ACJ77Z_10425 [Thermoleophilaceae bacterium]
MPDGLIARRELAESAAEYLEPGEEIVAAAEGGPAVDVWKGRRGIHEQPTPVGVRFEKHQMAVVITTERFLMFRLGGFLRNRARELLTDLPIEEVDSITYKSHAFKTFEVALVIYGIEYGFVVPHIAHRMEKALEAAKGGASA